MCRTTGEIVHIRRATPYALEEVQSYPLNGLASDIPVSEPQQPPFEPILVIFFDNRHEDHICKRN